LPVQVGVRCFFQAKGKSERNEKWERKEEPNEDNILIGITPMEEAFEGIRAMRVTIDEQLKAKCRRTTLVCVTAHVTVGAAPLALLSEMRRLEERILRLPEPRAVLEWPQILATRAAYKALGKDPARYRGSAEALLRRVIAGKGFPQINAVVDVINLVSAESRLPIGLYDLGHVSGDVVFRAGRAGETYKGIGKYDLNLEGLPLFADAMGPHGSATSDSERTMVTERTKLVLAIIVGFAGSEGIEKWGQRLAGLLAEHAAGKEYEVTVVG
jgi:DNA/RNA-binding domain of Phe-tRNA-synthetase-like protein